MVEPRSVAGLRQIVGDFDALLVDQFGVMHDGEKPYPGAVDALTRARQAGKAVVVLTNSGKRAASNRDRVIRVGFPEASFTDLVSSGEVAWTGIRDGAFGAPFVQGQRAGIVGKQGDDYGFDGLGLRFTADYAEADFLLILGSDCPRTSLGDYRALLGKAAQRSVPALCCNPDITMLTSHGLQPSAGAIAALYAELGGPVTFVGKPHPIIYRQAAHMAGATAGRVLAIGDSLDHDIKGGAGAGLRTALVRTGVLQQLSEAEWQEALRTAPDKPDYILPSLCW